MAINLNRVEVIGNLTRDPELRYTPNGQAVASFAVATNRRYQDQSGNWIDAEAEFHEVVVWAKMAEGANQVLKKGDRVYLTGRLQTRTWEGQDGSRRNKTEIVADTMIGPDQIGRASFGQSSGPTVSRPAPATPVTPSAPVAPVAPVSPATPASSPAESSTGSAESSASPKSDDEEINIEDIPF